MAAKAWTEDKMFQFRNDLFWTGLGEVRKKLMSGEVRKF